MPATLPPLPVDDVALDLYWEAMHGTPRSSLGELLALYATLAGSDFDDDCFDPDLRGAKYHPHDLLSALIQEIRRLRSEGQ